MKKGLAIIMIGLLVLTLNGCQKTADEVPTPSVPGDSLNEAKKKLFEELGIKEETPAPAQDAESLPLVLPTPPELPKTDADLNGERN